METNELEKIVVTTVHPGSRPNDGGEYGEWTSYVPMGGGWWARRYRSTGDQSFEYCPHTGDFHRCSDECPPEDYVVLSTEEVEAEIGSSIDELVPDWHGVARIDTTGHEFVLGVEGGCCICWPACGPAVSEVGGDD